jgi:hypothetical protein
MTYKEEVNKIIEDFGEQYIPTELKELADRELLSKQLEFHLEQLKAKVPQLKWQENFGVLHVTISGFKEIDIDLFDHTCVVKDDGKCRLEELGYYAQASIAWAVAQVVKFCEDRGFR